MGDVPVGARGPGDYTSSEAYHQEVFGDADMARLEEEMYQKNLAIEREQQAVARLAAEEAELAEAEQVVTVAETAEAAEEAAMMDELAAGPLGWIAELVTAAAVVGTAILVAEEMEKIERMKEQIDHDSLPKPQPLPQLPTPPKLPTLPSVAHEIYFNDPSFYKLLLLKKRWKI